MTYTHNHLYRILQLYRGRATPKRPLFYFSAFVQENRPYEVLVQAHLAHYLEFLCALLCYYVNFLPLSAEADELRAGWILRVVLFNVCVGWCINSFWHWVTYVSPMARSEVIQARKFNPINQYEPDGGPVRMFSSSTGHLEREICLTTLGWVQSGLWQAAFMHLWASGRLPFYADFWSAPLRSLAHLASVTYWRLFHFYWVHRFLHPWRVRWAWFGGTLRAFGLDDCRGDPGQFLYRHVHSLHHRSHNPGPWAGLSMHPVEHVFYYSCTLPCALYAHHPLVFLYNKFHADVSAVGGHDGYGDPGGNSDYHYLHHSRFEVNYGVPLVNLDALFGTFVSPTDGSWKGNPNLVPLSEWPAAKRAGVGGGMGSEEEKKRD